MLFSVVFLSPTHPPFITVDTVCLFVHYPYLYLPLFSLCCLPTQADGRGGLGLRKTTAGKAWVSFKIFLLRSVISCSLIYSEASFAAPSTTEAKRLDDRPSWSCCSRFCCNFVVATGHVVMAAQLRATANSSC